MHALVSSDTWERGRPGVNAERTFFAPNVGIIYPNICCNLYLWTAY